LCQSLYGNGGWTGRARICLGSRESTVQ
jgi:hypothetical protein